MMSADLSYESIIITNSLAWLIKAALVTSVVSRLFAVLARRIVRP